MGAGEEKRRWGGVWIRRDVLILVVLANYVLTHFQANNIITRIFSLLGISHRSPFLPFTKWKIYITTQNYFGWEIFVGKITLPGRMTPSTQTPKTQGSNFIRIAHTITRPSSPFSQVSGHRYSHKHIKNPGVLAWFKEMSAIAIANMLAI